MSDKRNNEVNKNPGGSNWPHKNNDWNIANKRPKLDIHKSHLSQSSSTSSKMFGPSTSGSSSGGRGGSMRRTNSMPASSHTSPSKESGEAFVDTAQEEFDAMEAKALAEYVSAFELSLTEAEEQATSNKRPTSDINFKNNGSSGFENLFAEEIAEEDIEGCMLLASQEIMANQTADISFSQAYNVFSKGVDAHSSVLDTGPVFKKPPLPAPSTSSNNNPRPISANSAKPPTLSSNHRGVNLDINAPKHSTNGAAQPRNCYVNQNRTTITSNPQAEAEVRRLSKLDEARTAELKQLKDVLRTKEGEASILRAQLKQAMSDKEQLKSRSIRSAAASEQQYIERLKDLEKELEAKEMELQFQKAETQTSKERYKVLLGNSERVRLVEPQSPGPSHVATNKTPTRHRHVSGFLNRSTFEEPLSPRMPAPKRPRLNEEEQHPPINFLPAPEPVAVIEKAETKSVGEQTDFDIYLSIGSLRLAPRTLGQKLSDRLIGVQLSSTEFSNAELWKNDDASFDEKEAIPTLSLLKTDPKSRQRCVLLDDKTRPCLLNCSQSLKHLLSWNDPTTDCPPIRAAICQIAEECTGILHYNLLLLQDNRSPSDKDLRFREHEIISRGLNIVPLKRLDLLDENQWYKEEYGKVEIRRSLGILSEIALASGFAASLLTGGPASNEIIIRKHRFTEIPEYAFVKQQGSHEDDKRYFLLKILCDICSVIVDQKLTIAFNGVLAGILTLLKSCAQQGVMEERSQSYILNVIRNVLIARPASTVLLLLVDLLTSVSKCLTIMRGLCTKCDEDDNVFDDSYGVCSFTKSSCPLQVLCIQLRAVSGTDRWQLIDSVSEWLVAVINGKSATHSWICSSPGGDKESHYPCCARLTSTLILLLSDAFEMFEEIIILEGLPTILSPGSPKDEDVDLKPILICVMRRSIILLLKLVENNLFQYMARVEGLYELLVQGIERIQKHLNLSSCLERYLADLLRAEQDTATRSATDQVAVDGLNVTAYLNSVTNILQLS